MEPSSTEPPPLVTAYLATLEAKTPATVDAYRRVLRQFCAWLVERPGCGDGFVPEQFTRTAVETYLAHLDRAGRSISDRTRVRAVLSSFARFLIEDQGVLRRNPTRQVVVPPQTILAPRELTEDQRYVLESLVERDDTLRGAAIFALGYWAGCRVSDVAWLRFDDTHVTARQGSILVGHKGGKQREIDLHGKVVAPLHAYLQQGGRKRESPYVFTSQRAERLTEAGIHHWFRLLKAQATKTEWELIHDLRFHDLRHDFAHRARAAAWSLEEIAAYLGHTTTRGTPAIQTTARYTQVSRDRLKRQLQRL
ncbi:tyrosine-type recombinase/integrase [Chloroflexus sp.]|jgi:site-specific recombinase XerD|uniref:tyrosine-type recombinase/integrase n=1 Tax=Chloroflexus sp. TaxID=1904827 RepID=UPI002ACE6AC4|nr:tyrosine-type recombinase/integrase [Chloroflexus sp.]